MRMRLKMEKRLVWMGKTTNSQLNQELISL